MKCARLKRRRELKRPITYLLTVLPTPTKQIFDLLEKKFTDFLWNGTRTRIHKKQLEKNIEEGGLKLINLIEFNKALKLGKENNDHIRGMAGPF